jgi:hypothetical protein
MASLDREHSVSIRHWCRIGLEISGGSEILAGRVPAALRRTHRATARKSGHCWREWDKSLSTYQSGISQSIWFATLPQAPITRHFSAHGMPDRPCVIPLRAVLRGDEHPGGLGPLPDASWADWGVGSCLSSRSGLEAIRATDSCCRHSIRVKKDPRQTAARVAPRWRCRLYDVA